MKYFAYEAISGAFTGAVMAAAQPDNSTLLAPPAIGEGLWPYFIDGAWVMQEGDNSGEMEKASLARSRGETTLAAARLGASSRIDAAAGAARGRYITVTAGQEATYMLKETQAREYMAADSPGDASPWPMVVAEAEAMQDTPAAASAFIIATADVWKNQLAPVIEKARRAGKIAVEAAASLEAITTAELAAIAILDAV